MILTDDGRQVMTKAHIAFGQMDNKPSKKMVKRKCCKDMKFSMLINKNAKF